MSKTIFCLNVKSKLIGYTLAKICKTLRKCCPGMSGDIFYPSSVVSMLKCRAINLPAAFSWHTLHVT